MKTTRLIIGLLLLTSLPILANPVDVNKAQKAAVTFMRSKTGSKAELRLIDYANKAEFQNFYVFGNDKSFVIISGDDCVQPVLGYSTCNPFGTEKMPGNVFWWLKGYDEQIAEAIKSEQRATEEVNKEWHLLVSGTTPRSKDDPPFLIHTLWDQTEPYNDSCPSGTLTGCVATAMAQIMKKFDYPAQGFGSHYYTPADHPEFGELHADFGTTHYDWGNMTDTYGASSTESEKQAVATLMYHCGVSVSMNYGTDADGGSGASTYAVVDALQNYFNYSQTTQYVSKVSYTEAQWKDILIQEISENRPIQYCGSKKVDGQTTGHSFVCDGYNSIDNKFHFNWGWGGNSDGWYLLSKVKYPINQAAIIGIQPISYNEHPTHLDANVSGRNVHLTWENLESADSYNVYRDYNNIGSTTSCSFNDTTASIGKHMYFVRGVKNGNVSLPSDTTTVNVVFGGTTEELKIDHLQATLDNGNASLEWSSPYRLNYIDYHSHNEDWYYSGTGNKEKFYWGSRFPAYMLPSGTSLTSVSYLFHTEGEYSIFIYQCTGGIPSGEPVFSVTDNYPQGWNNIVFPSSITLEPEKDLWIVFKSTTIPYPLTLIEYNADDGNYYSYNGNNWYHLQGCSFFISANLSDGTFTYNIYNGNTQIKTGLTKPSLTLNDIGTNAVHQYSVKAQKGENVSVASNTVGFTLGTAGIPSLSLSDKDQMTVAEGSTLTVDGTITNDSPANLIIEDGGQLIHPSSAVKATLKKAISGFGEDLSVKTGWYTIASPVADALTELATDGTYDLYAYDEPSRFWKNQKVEANNINAFKEGHGFLYANADNTSLEFAGDMKATFSNITVSLSYTDQEDGIAGFNLVGNPFSCNINSGDIYFNDTALTVYYTVENGENLMAHHIEMEPIKPGQGFFVQATDKGQNIEFNPTTSSKEGNDNSKTAFISIKDGNDNVMDCAIVQIGGGNTLRKMNINDNVPQVYVMQDGRDYAAAAFSEAQGEIPVNFKAVQNGTYTMTFSGTPNSQLSTLNFNYLRLIDNLTGANINLLVTPSYSFEARSDDYPSRFRLVFNANEGGPTNLDNILEGDCQIFDLTGRYIGIYHHVTLTPGVYIVRTINGNEIKTEKIRVR